MKFWISWFIFLFWSFFFKFVRMWWSLLELMVLELFVLKIFRLLMNMFWLYLCFCEWNDIIIGINFLKEIFLFFLGLILFNILLILVWVGFRFIDFRICLMLDDLIFLFLILLYNLKLLWSLFILWFVKVFVILFFCYFLRNRIYILKSILRLLFFRVLCKIFVNM